MDHTAVVAELERLVREAKPARAEAVRPGARLQSDIGLTSVEIVELVLDVEDAFAITVPDDDTGDLMDATLEELAARILQLRGE